MNLLYASDSFFLFLFLIFGSLIFASCSCLMIKMKTAY